MKERWYDKTRVKTKITCSYNNKKVCDRIDCPHECIEQQNYDRVMRRRRKHGKTIKLMTMEQFRARQLKLTSVNKSERDV